MAGRQTADILFCMDASGSMSDAFDGVRNHVNNLLNSIRSDLQIKWDVRFDFLAYANTSRRMSLRSMSFEGDDLIKRLYGGAPAQGGLFGALKSGIGLQGKGSTDGFFTSDLDRFKSELAKIECEADEATVLALDLAADFPFRDAAVCHRAVVLLTDEPVDRGVFAKKSITLAPEVAKKYQDRKIALFMVTPPCETFDVISQADRCEWAVTEDLSFKNVDFAKLMHTIGKSVSVSQTGSTGCDRRPLFNEPAWKSQNEIDKKWVTIRFGDTWADM